MNNIHHGEDFRILQGQEMRKSLADLQHTLDVWAMRDPEQMDDLRHIMQRQVRQLTRLSEDFLDMACIEREGLELHSEQIPLQAVVEDACKEIRPFIDRNQQVLTIKSLDVPINVYADPLRLVKVIANLFQNAANSTERRGTIWITIQLQRESAEEGGDNGHAMEQNRFQTTYEAGSELNAACVTVNDGLGGGLKLVTAIEESHDGTLAVHGGATGQDREFTAVLPLRTKEPRAVQLNLPHVASKREMDRRQLSPCRIVVLDDDQELAELLAQLLRKIGQSVTVANNGEDAIRTVLLKRPQVVFLDLTMQGMDGYGVARRLREHPDLVGLTLVMLSGNASEDHKIQAREAGIDKYLVKPVDLATLTEVLFEVSANHSDHL